MASASGKGASKNRANSGKNTSKSTRKTTSNARGRRTPSKSRRKNVDVAVKNEVMLIVIFAAAIFLFLCVIGIVHGTASAAISKAMFGVFGLLAYIVPIIIFLGFAFGISNKGNTVAIIKLVSSVILVFLAGIIAFLIMKQEQMIVNTSLVKDLYNTSAEHRAGGGVLFGSIAHGLHKLVGFGGTLFVVAVLGIISIVFITEKSFLSGVKKGGSYLIESAKEDAIRMREYRESLREEYDDDFDEDLEDFDELEEQPSKRPKRVREEQRKKEPPKKQPEQKVRRIDKKARGVAASSAVTLKSEKQRASGRQDIHEIVLLDEHGVPQSETVCEDISIKPYNSASYDKGWGSMETEDPVSDFSAEEVQAEDSFLDNMGVSVKKSFLDEFGDSDSDSDFQEEEFLSFLPEDSNDGYDEIPDMAADIDRNGFQEDYENDIKALESMPEPMTEDSVVNNSVTGFTGDSMAGNSVNVTRAETMGNVDIGTDIAMQDVAMQAQVSAEEAAPKQYIFPPLNLLKKGDGKKGDSTNQLKETALRLQQTLANFGVKVVITDISQGPSVTRYEMQPEQGVKVSKIVGLADDIKLNLAATDIRIEAPIPGKAAVGIEVPNKETSAVALRDLLEADEFQNFPSNLAFAAGKDIAGQVVVTDIAKMPHVLIAGATGSGKSVCINTIIMSILYKADPSDVKLIMIDPKVVELSVYNGIPHLMIPVVTDPKKASAALNWGVAEMNDRYNKFANLNVRDLKGFNKAVEQGKTSPDGEPLQKLPQIVIIVDELADLMMVASNEVEESICRLAQLARACGIHLVIATQRPSVDVITGLIKANMPSRIAFSVSSGVDSRTILDMNGAEKLLGKGDMLFYPQGYTKPARVQGAFVSDSEVSDVVDFLKNQMLGNTYNNDIEDKIKTLQSPSGSAGSAGGSDVDAYFAEAAKFVIEKDKASIGMLQRVFKIGFNRAARIVDQLEDAGVVGAEEGTKPRRILMSMEQFENYMEEKM